MRLVRQTPIIIGGVILALLLGGVWLLQPARSAPITANLSLSEALGTSVEGFARADKPRPFSFPADHGPHPGFQTEWWYYTGNLDSADGRHFGYQLTFFRRQLAPTPAARSSQLAANNIYMAHFALVDVQNNQFYAYDRYSRDGGGLAGAQADPFRVWTESWEAGAAPADGMRLRAAQGPIAIDLVARNTKPVVLQGDQGLSQKTAGAGNASYYYSLTRMATEGTITIDGQPFSVQGSSWMDREWSTTSINEGIAGWDWFALQFDNGYELMYYQLRRTDGSIEPLSNGTLIAPDGTTSRLALNDVQVEVLDRWTSPQSGATYPSRWRVTIPARNITVEVRPYVAQQELPFAITYWEGAVQITGTMNGATIAGNGYVELTGYVDQQRSTVTNRVP